MRSPFTSKPLNAAFLIPNRALLDALTAWKELHPLFEAPTSKTTPLIPAFRGPGDNWEREAYEWSHEGLLDHGMNITILLKKLHMCAYF